MSDTELQRYINYFQRSLLCPDSESFFEGQKKWFEKNRIVISEQLKAISREEHDRASSLASAVVEHEDLGKFDDFFSSHIFEPLLEKTLEICKKAGFSLKNTVRFANSPGMEPSPAVLPSTADHLIFAGQGTFAFCNYWAKVFSTAIYAVSTLSKKSQKSPEAILNKLRRENVLFDASRLAVYYALNNSLIGFGKLSQPEKIKPIRALLVNAMEVFIIGHEVGHCIGYEAWPETQGISDGSSAKDHEFECDSIGLAVCTGYGAEENNAFAFQLVGPLLFFYAMEICEQVKSILAGKEPDHSESHPTCKERFAFALDFLHGVGANETVLSSVNFSLDIATHIGNHVQLMAQNLKPILGEVELEIS
jgi:hypothetical protein